jgi:hypothetical protein
MKVGRDGSLTNSYNPSENAPLFLDPGKCQMDGIEENDYCHFGEAASLAASKFRKSL